MSSSSKPVIQLKNVTKEFHLGKNVVSAVKDVNLEIESGEFVILFGPSGCGKSTLLNLVSGLEVPSSGKILIRGESLAKATPQDLAKHRREKLGMVFQQFNLLKTMSVANNVALPALFRSVKRSTRLKHARQLLSELGIKRHQYKLLPTELSGGEQQRVAIARSLINNPWILLADEPTGNVDSSTADEIMELFRDLNRKSRRTILLVTHNPDYLQRADRVIYMRDGEVVTQEKHQRSRAEVEEVELAREAEKLARDGTRKDLNARAKALGLKPTKYKKEVDLAEAVLKAEKSAKPDQKKSAKTVKRNLNGKSKSS